jgi:hypothetical protein
VEPPVAARPRPPPPPAGAPRRGGPPPPRPPAPAPPADEEPAELAELAPLGPEDEGRLVRVSGAVVGQPTPEGFWVLTDRDEVVFVATARPVVTGEHVDVSGTLTANTEAEAGAWFEHARLREAVGWNIERRMHVRVGEPPEILPREPDMPERQPEAGPARQRS